MLTGTRRCLHESRIRQLNKLTGAEELGKWGKQGGPSKGMPMKARSDMGRIEVIHETPTLVVAGRNRCNAFNGNQYAIIAKATQQACLVDMADDWADDWHIFLDASGAVPTCIFFTHLHMDCLLGLTAFLNFYPNVGLAWNRAELYWAHKWAATCKRYVRPDLAACQLPFHDMGPMGPGVEGTSSAADATGLARLGRRGNNILITGDGNRLTPTIVLAPDLELFHIPTPGHSLGHMCLHVPRERLLFTGDLIFHNRIGRVDLPNASGRLQAQSLRALEDLPDQTVLLPGHGRLTTLGRERRNNPGLQRLYELIGAGVEDLNVGMNFGWF